MLGLATWKPPVGLAFATYDSFYGKESLVEFEHKHQRLVNIARRQRPRPLVKAAVPTPEDRRHTHPWVATKIPEKPLSDLENSQEEIGRSPPPPSAPSLGGDRM